MKSLDQKGVKPDEVVNIFETAPSPERLAEMIGKSGLGIKKFFNTSGEVYKEMQLKDKLPGMSEADMIALLASNGRLIKRPIVYDGERVTVGFKEDEYERVWKRSRE
jgi:arsenate reductase